MTLFVKKLDARAILPTRGSEKAAGYDLYALDESYINPGDVTKVRTGIAIAIPPGHYARVAPRSGLAANWGVDVLAGVIDEDYRGEVVVLLTRHAGRYSHTIQAGDRIAQIVLEKISTPEIKEVETLPDTARGAAGFGSSGL